MAAGVFGFLYAVSFVVISRSAPELGVLLSGLFLLLGAKATIAALVGLYERLLQQGQTYALLALALGLIGTTGALVHGGFDLANALHPPASMDTTLPSAIDPRGLLTFGVSGLALGLFSWLIRSGSELPRGLGALGYLLTGLMLSLYLGRLIILDAASPAILGPALVAGFVVNPWWYIWLGLALRKSPAP